MRGWSRLTACLALVAAGACASPVDQGVQGADVRGTWSYSATQAAPAAQLTGTLTVVRQEGSTFDAELEVQERDPQGNVRNWSAVVAGRTVGTDVVDFDVFVDAFARRHVGRVAGDSIIGTWAQLDDVPRSGTFRSRRQP
jgi:hypothetical protein